MSELRRCSVASKLSQISTASAPPEIGLYSSIIHETNYDSEWDNESDQDSDSELESEIESDFENEMGSIQLARMINLGDGRGSKGLGINYDERTRSNIKMDKPTRLTHFQSDFSTFSDESFYALSPSKSNESEFSVASTAFSFTNETPTKFKNLNPNLSSLTVSWPFFDDSFECTLNPLVKEISLQALEPEAIEKVIELPTRPIGKIRSIRLKKLAGLGLLRWKKKKA